MSNKDQDDVVVFLSTLTDQLIGINERAMAADVDAFVKEYMARHPIVSLRLDPFDINNPGTDDVWETPPPWFRYFVQRLFNVAALGDDRYMAAELDDALEKISPYGTLPEWRRPS